LGVSIGLFGFVTLLGIVGTWGAAALVFDESIRSLREFIRWTIDVAALPPICAAFFSFTGLPVGFSVGCLAARWLELQQAFAIGTEFGLFAALAGCPFIPFFWPVMHRALRWRTDSSLPPDSWILPPWVVEATFLVASIPLFLAWPWSACWVVFVAAWIGFCFLYRHVLHRRFPRFIWPTTGHATSDPST
jgi:hypothetical protein